MKILKAPETEWSYKCKCYNCTAELLVEKQDIKYKSDYDMREGSWETWSVVCINCNHGFEISPNHIPQAVKTEIKDGRVKGTG